VGWWTDSSGSQRQPQGISARGAAQRVGHAKLFFGGSLEGGYVLTKDELLRLKHARDGIHQLTVERAVLALQVQHGYWYRRGGWSGCARGSRRLFHPTILPAGMGGRRHLQDDANLRHT
jgi:hypothetical protein